MARKFDPTIPHGPTTVAELRARTKLMLEERTQKQATRKIKLIINTTKKMSTSSASEDNTSTPTSASSSREMTTSMEPDLEEPRQESPKSGRIMIRLKFKKPLVPEQIIDRKILIKAFAKAGATGLATGFNRIYRKGINSPVRWTADGAVIREGKNTHPDFNAALDISRVPKAGGWYTCSKEIRRPESGGRVLQPLADFGLHSHGLVRGVCKMHVLQATASRAAKKASKIVK